MASEVDFQSLVNTNSGGKGKKTNYLKFESGKSYKVRPIGKAVEFFKFFVHTPKGPRSICVETDVVDKAAALLSSKTGKEVKPQHRFAMNIIDRSDNQIKILEGGKSIFSSFGTWAKASNIHPGGKSGYDWMISVDGDGLQRRYNSLPLQSSPLSNKEVEEIQAKSQTYSLKTIYKGVSLDELIEKAFGDGSSAPDPEVNDDTELPKETVGAGSGSDDILF